MLSIQTQIVHYIFNKLKLYNDGETTHVFIIHIVTKNCHDNSLLVFISTIEHNDDFINVV